MGPWVGVKPEIFQGIGGFVESEHSDKYFIKKEKKKKKKAPQRKFGSFRPRYS